MKRAFAVSLLTAIGLTTPCDCDFYFEFYGPGGGKTCIDTCENSPFAFNHGCEASNQVSSESMMNYEDCLSKIDYANLNVVQQVAAASNCEHDNCHGPDYKPGSLYEVGDFVNLIASADCA